MGSPLMFPKLLIGLIITQPVSLHITQGIHFPGITQQRRDIGIIARLVAVFRVRPVAVVRP